MGASLPIGVVVGKITTPGEPATVDYTLGTGQIQSNQRVSMLLAFVPSAAPGSSAQPDLQAIASMQDLPTYNLKRTTPPLFTQVAIPSLSGPATVYRARVNGLNFSSGNYYLTAYLPGDTNGDGVVDRTDVAVVRTAYGSTAGSSKYRAVADMNQDGIIGELDWIVSNRNLGARSSMVALSQPSVTPT